MWQTSSLLLLRRENLEDLQQIVAQLENDRFIASRRAQRLEEELKSQEKVGKKWIIVSVWSRYKRPHPLIPCCRFTEKDVVTYQCTEPNLKEIAAYVESAIEPGRRWAL